MHEGYAFLDCLPSLAANFNQGLTGIIRWSNYVLVQSADEYRIKDNLTVAFYIIIKSLPDLTISTWLAG